MMRSLHPPIRDVRALLDFLAHWCNVPADVPPVDVPEETPPPLSELYERFWFASCQGVVGPFQSLLVARIVL